MIFKNFKVLGILLLLLAVFTVGGKKVSAAVEDGDIQYTIGVVVYNQDSPEMNMFMNYYREYIHPEDDWSSSINTGDVKRNLIHHEEDEHGNVEKILSECDEIIEHTYRIKAAQQAYMETCRAYCEIDRYGRLHCIIDFQGASIRGAPCFCFIMVGCTSKRITATPYRFLPAPARTTR